MESYKVIYNIIPIVNIFFSDISPPKYIQHLLPFANVSHNFFQFTFWILLPEVPSQYWTYVGDLLKWLLNVKMNYHLPACFDLSTWLDFISPPSPLIPLSCPTSLDYFDLAYCPKIIFPVMFWVRVFKTKNLQDICGIAFREKPLFSRSVAVPGRCRDASEFLPPLSSALCPDFPMPTLLTGYTSRFSKRSLGSLAVDGSYTETKFASDLPTSFFFARPF